MSKELLEKLNKSYKKTSYRLNLQLFADPGEGNTDPLPEPTVPKAQFDALATEIAKLKKEARERLTDDEKRAAEAKEKDDLIISLQKQVKMSSIKGGLATAGLDEKSIDAITTAYVEGNDADFIKNIGSVIKAIKDAHAKEIENIKLDLTPRPGEGTNGGVEDKTVTREEFNKMSYAEQYEFKQKNPELYKQIMKK